MKKNIAFIFEIIGVIVLIVLDRLSKIWAVASLKGNDGIELINGVLKFYYLPNGNTGAAFGILKGNLWLFILITVLVVALLVYLIYKVPFIAKFAPMHITFIFIIAGGIGNLIDRIFNHYVVDFIYFYLIDFPIFNVADCYVTVSTIVIALLLLFYYDENDLKKFEEYGIPRYFKKNKES